MSKPIPFYRPFVTESPYLQAALEQPGAAPIIAATEAYLQKLTNTNSLLTTSCTHALEMAILMCVQAGDEVIMPSFTFVSVANAVILRGATPVFVDIDPRSLAIDPICVAAAITPKTKAIVVMHYAGIAADTNALMQLATDHNLTLIEDAAHCIGAKDALGRHLGSIGHYGALSFHYTKNIQCGEGGALLVNDETGLERSAILRDKGTNRKAFLQGQTDKYTWVDVGSSYSISAVQAALLLGQLELLAVSTQKRLQLWQKYYDALLPLQASGLLQLPQNPHGGAHNGHIFFVILQNKAARIQLQEHLSEQGIGSAFHYVPLHSAPKGLAVGRFHGEDIYTTQIAESLLRLPLYHDLSEAEVARVCEVVNKWGEARS